MTDYFTAVLARTADRRPALTRRALSTFETPHRPHRGPAGGPEWTSVEDGGLEEETVVRSVTPPPVRAQPSSRATPGNHQSVPERSRQAQPRHSRPDTEAEAPADVRPERTQPSSPAEPAGTHTELLAANVTVGQVANPRTGRRRPRVRDGLDTIVEPPAAPDPAPQPVLRTQPTPATARAEPVVQHHVDEVSVEPPQRAIRSTPVARPDRTAARPPQEQPLRRQRPPVASPAVPPAPQPPPTIHVTIGRIEVRATPARSVQQPPAPRPAVPKLGLDDYLRSRNGRVR